MKNLYLLLLGIFLSSVTFAQDAPKNYLEAFYDTSTGMISYRKSGELTKDGMGIIEMKTIALATYMNSKPTDIKVIEAIQAENKSLEKLRERILVQRERLMKPLPPMEEIH
jgi:hypothetical protein